MAVSHLILSDLVPDGLRQRLVDCAETYRFTPPDPRGGGAFAMSRIAGAGTAAIRELVEWLSPRCSGLPGLRSFAPNEASFQRYEAGSNGLAPHRDQRYYVNAIAIFTLQGQARLQC